MFQSTRPRGARRRVCIDADRYMPFQSTRPRGARRFVDIQNTNIAIVSIHAPAWGATCGLCQAPATWAGFNPRARVGRDACNGARRPGSRRFNPRARVGRDPVFESFFAFRVVSIHAPAWGATLRCFILSARVIVSIHAPAWGATSSRADLHWQAPVSIHAPAWGATPRAFFSTVFNAVSIHAPAWGATFRKTCIIR